MNWIQLTSDSQLSDLNTKSAQKPQVIFKHSTRCSVSAMVQSRLQRKNAPEEIDFYYIEVPAQRMISNKIAEVYHVFHESPQVLIIKNGECVYDESHYGIDFDEIVAQTAK